MLIKYNRANVLGAYGVRLIPGVNRVKIENDPSGEKMKLFVDMLKVDSELVRLLDEGVLEIIAEEQKLDESLNEMDKKAALRLIAETFDENQLRAWHDNEQRRDVKRALESQIEKMKAL